MALVASIHVEPGWQLPEMNVQNIDGESVALPDQVGKNGLLVVFTCNHCPYAIALWPRLLRHADRLKALGVNSIAVNPNIHPDYPADGVAAMADKVTEWGIDFPYLADENQAVARAFDAQCTPDVYLFDGDGKLYYHGRIDDCWKDEGKVTSQELLSAVELMLVGKDAPQPQHPSIGCSIKWA